MADGHAKVCVDKINLVNQLVDKVRVCYKARQYEKASDHMTRALETISDLIHHTELMPDNIDQVYVIAKAFQKLNIPMLTSDTIVYSSCGNPFPVNLNFAGMYFYIFETGKQFIEYAHHTIRVLGKRAADGSNSYARRRV